MSFRAPLLVILFAPLLAFGGAVAFGLTIPVPQFGRDYVLRFVLRDEARSTQLPPVDGPEDSARPLVVIDPGHGGRDPGAVGAGDDGAPAREKEITLALALALRSELLEQGGIRVALTRTDDRTLGLNERSEIARLLEADLFLSIHADSAGDLDDVSGASIYTLSNEASSEAAARFATRENNADRVNGLAVDGQSARVNAILVELSQQRMQEDALEFAALIAREGAETLAFHPQTRRSAALEVLRAPDVPSVLFESGFVTNQSDRALLTTEEGRATYAKVLSRAIRVYFARRAQSE